MARDGAVDEVEEAAAIMSQPPVRRCPARNADAAPTDTTAPNSESRFGFRGRQNRNGKSACTTAVEAGSELVLDHGFTVWEKPCSRKELGIRRRVVREAAARARRPCSFDVGKLLEGAAQLLFGDPAAAVAEPAVELEPADRVLEHGALPSLGGRTVAAAGRTG